MKTCFLFADQENMVKVIIDQNADMIDVKNEERQTPLYLVKSHTHTDTPMYLSVFK